MSRFNQAELLNHINEVDRRMHQAHDQIGKFVSTCKDIYSRWYAYLEIEDDSIEEENARVVFATKTRKLVDDNVEGLAAALDIIAGGMRNSEGEPLTRQDLLDELAAVVVPPE